MKYLRLLLCLNLVACGKLEMPNHAGEAGAPEVNSVDRRSITPSSAAQAFGTDDKVYAITSDADSWYVGGAFTAVKTVAAPGFLELGLDGAVAPDCLKVGGFNAYPSAVVATADSIYVGGSFTAYEGQPVRYLAKLSRTDCTLDTNFSRTAPNGFNSSVFSLLIDNGWLYVGGAFTSYDNVPASANYIARLNLTTGAMDSSLFGAAGSTNNGFDAYVSRLLISGGSLYVAGNFTAYRGVTNSAQKIAKLSLTDASLDPIFGTAGPTSNGFDGTVYALASDGTSLFVGGRFTAYRGVANSANNVAKIQISNGALDLVFSPNGANSNGFTGGGGYQVNDLLVAGTSLYAAGYFWNYRGNLESAWSVAKLDTATGNQDTVFSPPGRANNGFGAEAKALALENGFLYVGGTFSGYYRGGYQQVGRLAKLDATSGALDTTFINPGSTLRGFPGEALNNYAVSNLFIEGNSLFAVGQFTNYGGLAANRFAKFRRSDGAFDLTVSPQGGAANGFNLSVRSILLSDDALVIGGSYSSYRGVSARGAIFINKADGVRLFP